jgi:hypothetical protein
MVTIREVISLLVGMLIAFFFCSQWNFNPLGGEHILSLRPDTAFLERRIEVPVPVIEKERIEGSDLTPIQRQRIVMMRDTITEFIPTGCPDGSYAINDSLRWYQQYIVADPQHGQHTVSDSGWAYVSYIADCIGRRSIDTKIRITPLHPVIFERVITNTMTVRPPKFDLAIFGESSILRKGQWRVGVEGRMTLDALAAYIRTVYDAAVSVDVQAGGRYSLTQ